MASHYFEEGDHTRYLARVENNVGDLLYSLNRYSEALAHMDRARDLLVALKDTGTVAQINEARAKVFVKLHRYAEAEIAATGAVHILEQGDEASLLAEALITHGIALARMGKDTQSRNVFLHAAEVAERGGDSLRASQAHLTLMEELAKQMLPGELARHYKAADHLAGDAPDGDTSERLRASARLCMDVMLEKGDSVGIDAFLIGGTLEQEILRLEEELLRRALDKAQGRITVAARLLGTSHQNIDYRIRMHHPNLLAARTPAQIRRRSIIKKEGKKTRRSQK
jgi:tetratricopeptide (TPR) repeat protein